MGFDALKKFVNLFDSYRYLVVYKLFAFWVLKTPRKMGL